MSLVAQLVSTVVQPALMSPQGLSLAGMPEASQARALPACFHCGEPCRDPALAKQEKHFCCQGCLVVHELLSENGLEQFYSLSQHPGVKIKSQGQARWRFLEDPAVEQRLLDYSDERTHRVTFHVPSIHCVACVWLLENLFRLHPGISRSRVHFGRREVAVHFDPNLVRLAEVAALLDSLGYEPRVSLGELEKRAKDPSRKKRWLQVGIAGFAFGNIMMMSLPIYIGLDSLSGPLFSKVFGWLSLVMALPVVVYSAGDYWRSAWLSFRRRMITLDVPIVAGLGAIYLRSIYEIGFGVGEGYLDSLTGLIFFLLLGRVFQQTTYERLSFDRDYKSFFPLSATRLTAKGEQSVAITSLEIGDRLLIRHGEVVPADAKLVRGPACVDYSFVTGELDPVRRQPGDYLYAGGQQKGQAIEVQILKPVSQSYLTSLWDHAAFRKPRHDDLNNLTNRFSVVFTIAVVVISLSVAATWLMLGSPGMALKTFTAVLIVACPCALALSVPFTLGTAQRILARCQIFLRNVSVLEQMARVQAIVFDKTGTLTSARGGAAEFLPAGAALSDEEMHAVYALTRQSTHPHSIRISEACRVEVEPKTVSAFGEIAGKGVEGEVNGKRIRLGSPAWFEELGCEVGSVDPAEGSRVCLAVNGSFRGQFSLPNALRPEVEQLLERLRGSFELALLSGDNDRARSRLAPVFGAGATLAFEQNPMQKLEFVRKLQSSGKAVMMVGDGLNDAGALRQADVGVAVVEKVGAFSPASDAIVEGSQVPRIAEVLVLAKRSVLIIRLSFILSALYNLIGIGFAATGLLSPLVAAILMPVSSFTVVFFACGLTRWAARALNFQTQ